MFRDSEGGPPAAGASPPRGRAPIDLTGYWASIVSEDWRTASVTPHEGRLSGVLMTPEAVKIADAWDPAADTSAGHQCKSYGRPPSCACLAASTSRGRTTTRCASRPIPARRCARSVSTLQAAKHRRRRDSEPSWQGGSLAQWETPSAGRGGRGASSDVPRTGSLRGRDHEPKSRLPPEERSALQREREGDRYFDSPVSAAANSCSSSPPSSRTRSIWAATLHRQPRSSRSQARREGLGSSRRFGHLRAAGMP